MNSETLYIIGNGFDLHHGLQSRYKDFKDYIQDKPLLENLNKYFEKDELWSDFEETLAHLNTELIVEECLNYLQSYITEQWSDAFHHDYQYEMKKRIDIVTDDLKKSFTNWILQLTFPDDALDKRVEIKSDSKFLCFNYTNTLERLYKIPSSNILYIHNKAENEHSILILGHSRDPNKNKKFNEPYDEEGDPRVAEGNHILDRYFEETYKSTAKIILQNTSFFSALTTLNEIYVFGHSLSPVDLPYFEEIIGYINKATTKWKISIHSEEQIKHHKETMESLGINLNLVEFDKIENFDSGQLELF